jgi:hypothetical protein
LSTAPRRFSQQISCGNPQGLRCIQKARRTKHVSWSWTLSKRLAALLSSSQPVTYRESSDIMIATLRKGCLALATLSFVAFRTSRFCTSLTQDGKDRSLSRGLQDQDLINFGTPMVRMYPTRGTSSTCDGSTPKQTRVQFLYALMASFTFLGRFGGFVPHNPKCRFLNLTVAAFGHA